MGSSRTPSLEGPLASTSWWADIAMHAPPGVTVHVGTTEVRVEYASVAHRVRGTVASGVALGFWTLTMVVRPPGAALLAILLALAAGAAMWRWLSRPTAVRLDGSRIVLADPIRGAVAVRWGDVVQVALQEAVPAYEDSDRGVPASVRVDRRRPPFGAGDALRLGIPLTDEGRAWLLALVTTCWRSAALPPTGTD